jgi:hypothetical protein
MREGEVKNPEREFRKKVKSQSAFFTVSKYIRRAKNGFYQYSIA